MAVVYIVAKGGGQWRLYVKDTGTGHTRWTPGSKRKAKEMAREKAKSSVESSRGPDSALFIELGADREVKNSRVYGEEADVDAYPVRDRMRNGPFGVPVEVRFKHGPGPAETKFFVTGYMTKLNATQNADRIRDRLDS